MAGTLFVVATPIGNLEDISARALRVLREVGMIAAEDTRRTSHLLQRYGITTRSISFHEHNAKSKIPGLISRMKSGESVAVVTDAGTPGISDPGQNLVREAHAERIPVVPVPGPSAVTAALSASGFEGESFVFLGFPPSKGKRRSEWLERLSALSKLVPVAVFYEAPHRVTATFVEIARLFPDGEIALCRELTKVHETIEVGHMAKMTPPESPGEYVAVLKFGQKTDNGAAKVAASPSALLIEFGDMTEIEGLSRRAAIRELSARYRLPGREIYKLLESAKATGV